ncbi:MAG: IS1634 family transposase [Myroides sp.]
MFVKQNKSWKGTLLTFTIGYRENGKVKHKNVETIGYLDDLKKEYDDPITHFKEIAKERSNSEINELIIKNLHSQVIDDNNSNKNLGYIALKSIYNELGLETLFKSNQKSLKIQYSINDIVSMLVYMRVLNPSSKKFAYENMNILFEEYDFSRDDMYRCLSIINGLKNQIEKVMWEKTKDKYQRDTTCSFYDCTNYYFEIEYNDDDVYESDKKGNPVLVSKGLRKRGPEKNHRPDPIVEMGLLMDKNGIPLSYNLFPGNESEKLTLIPIVKKTTNSFNLGRTIVVADRGLNTSDNIIKIAGISLEQAQKLNGYVYGQSVRGADDEFKSWILKKDYITEHIKNDYDENITFIHKSRMFPKPLKVLREDKGKTKCGNNKYQTILVDQKQMVYYSQKYADKQKRDRDMILIKAKDLIANPIKYKRSTSYGVAGYVENLTFVKETGEIADASNLKLNEERIKEEEKYDGYYSIVTSEEKLSDVEIRNIYRGLSKIEETFKVTKTGLEARPVWVSRQDHIESHFLTCFIALVIIRLLEQKLNHEFSFKKIIDTIRNYTSTKLDHDIYIQNFKNDVTDNIGEKLAIDLNKKYRSLSEIKKILKNL